MPNNAKPVAAKSRCFNKEDQEFIGNEISHMLSKGIIELCYSPWRAQLVVAKDPLYRLFANMNLFATLDVYPLLRIDGMVNDLAKYKVFLTCDLKSASIKFL